MRKPLPKSTEHSHLFIYEQQKRMLSNLKYTVIKNGLNHAAVDNSAYQKIYNQKAGETK